MTREEGIQTNTPTAPQQALRPVVSLPLKHDVSPPLSSIKPIPPKPGEVLREIPRLPMPKALANQSKGRALGPILQDRPGTINMPPTIQNFEGINNVNGVLPPDTQGDVGPNHYVQWVNLSFAIWDKDGNLLYGPADGNTLWVGFGGICESNNDGDPITLYDPIADRWLMSQFALNFPNDFHQCIAISQTGDPTGAWYRYDYQVSTTKMNDYPKFGVWPDAYYMTANQFDGSTFAWAGAGVWAFERDKMLTGDAAQMVYFDLYGVNPNYGGMLPADLDGWTLPPSGTPGLFVEWDDSDWLDDPADTLRIWEFHVDWDTPANSTFGIGGAPNYMVTTADVDPDMCGGSRNCIPQPGGTALDAIADRLMYRLQYRNFGSYQTLVSNHTVDVDGIDHAGIHWFELRNNGGGWNMYQEGVYAPDSDHRWMGSVALDRQGNMAMGYSVSSGDTYPSIRYAGRLAGDPLGTLPQAEVEIIAGSGYQQHSSGRWGDYSMIAVDPVDDCTFWYTQEYYEVVGTAPWQTRIASFQFPSCLGPTGTLSGTVTEDGSGTPIIGAKITAETNPTFVTYSQPPNGAYELSAIPTGTYTVTAQAYGYLPQTSTGVQVYSGTVTTQDFQLSAAPSYVISGTVTDATTGWPLYARIDIDGYPGDAIWTNPETGFYSITLVAGITYTFDVAAWVDGYLPENRDVAVADNATENFALEADLATCNAPGYEPSYAYLEDFEADDGNYTHGGDEDEWEWGTPIGWPDGCADGTSCWGTDLDDTYGDNADNWLMSPVITLNGMHGQNTTLAWQQAWEIESSTWDHAYAEITLDGGATWIEMWSHTGGTATEDWQELKYEFTVPASEQIQIRWRMTSDGSITYRGLYVDRVSILRACVPLPGGLVVGNVYDDNTGDPLVGAEVENEDSYATTTEATPNDPAINDGFYTLFSPTGSKTFTATMSGGYAPDVASVTVVQSDTVRQDFYLAAGWLSYAPPALEVTLELGMTTTLPLTLSNNGGVPANYELLELDKGWGPLGPFESPLYVVKPSKSYSLTAEGLTLLDPPQAPPYAAGDIIQAWPTGLTYAWGLGYNTLATDLWLGNIGAGGGDDLDYRFLPDGTNTGDAIDTSSWIGYWAGDITFNQNTGMLWQVNVGGDNCIYELDPVSLAPTGNNICPGFSTSQRGLAYDPTTDTYFAGGWNDSMIHHFASDGTMLDEVNVSLAIAGLAYNPDTQHLFVIVNASPNLVYVLDATNNYAVLGQFSVASFSDYGGAGLAMDCDGTLWAVDQQAQTVYQFESGESTTMCSFDVPWLSEDPISGTVASMANTPITVTFDAGQVAQPGTYYAQLKVKDDTPYDVPNAPVTMTVTAPPTWGKLNGTVTGLGYCDADPNPLEGAQIHIQSANAAVTTTTVLSEDFETWLPTGWTIVTNGGDCTWESTATTGRPNYAGGDGEAADADSDWCGSGTTMDTELWTPAIDLSGYDEAKLDFVAAYNDITAGGGDYFAVDVSSDGGATWTNLLSWNEDHDATGPGEAVSIDLTPYLSDQVVVRFHYVAPGWDWWAEVDQVRVIGSVYTGIWSLETDENGYYQVWFDEAYSPVTVTVTHPDHEDGMVTEVAVTGQMTITQDFDLRWLKPCGSASPPFMEVTVVRGTSETLPLVLSNDGAMDMAFEMRETTKTLSLPLPTTNRAAGHGEWLYRASQGVALSTNTGEQKLAYPAAYRWEPAAPSQFNVLVYADDFIHTPPNTYVDRALQALGIAYTAHYDGDFSGFAADLSNGGPWDLVIFENTSYNSNGVGFPEMLAYVQDGGKLAAEIWTMLWDNTDPLYAEMGVSYVSNDVAAPPVYWWAPSHNIFNVPESAPEWLTRNCPARWSCGQYLDPVSGVSIALAGYTTPGPNVGQATLILRNDEQTVYKGFADITTDADIDGDGTPDGIELWENIATGLLEGFGGADIPWLDEDPIAGTVSTDSSVPVSITFTAFPTMTGGIYTATLIVKTDDPVNSSLDLPVTMTVVYAPVCSFTASSPDDLGMTTIFTNTTDEGYSPTTYRWNFGDGSGVSAAANPTHTYNLPGLYTAVLTATNAYGANVCTATVSVEGVVAGFTSNSPVLLGEEMVFTNTTVANPGIVQWMWTFGDSGIAYTENPVHTYTAPGTYTVTLLAAIAPSGPNSPEALENVYDFYVDTVEVITACQPVTGASFSWLPATPVENETVTFTGTVAAGTSPITYTWAFGDGATASGATVAHAYTSAGNYTVWMTATNCNGTGASVISDTLAIAAPVSSMHPVYLPLIGKNTSGN